MPSIARCLFAEALIVDSKSRDLSRPACRVVATDGVGRSTARSKSGSGNFQTSSRVPARSFVPEQQTGGDRTGMSASCRQWKWPLLSNHVIDRRSLGRHRDACFPSTKLTSTPFLTDFANRSTSQFVILTQPCDSDLLTRDGSAVP
jgi:hypothetical protein